MQHSANTIQVVSASAARPYIYEAKNHLVLEHAQLLVLTKDLDITYFSMRTKLKLYLEQSSTPCSN